MDRRLADTTVSPGRLAQPWPNTLWFTLDDHDRHRRLTLLATTLASFGLSIAVALAVFGLPGLDVHPPLHHLGIMDPLCGGTRAARLTVQGDLAGAWTYNPLGIVVVYGAVAALGRTVLGTVTGRWLNAHLLLTGRQRRTLIAVAVVLTILLEIRQQLRSDLLTARA
jgi:hypothetical protein